MTDAKPAAMTDAVTDAKPGAATGAEPDLVTDAEPGAATDADAGRTTVTPAPPVRAWLGPTLEAVAACVVALAYFATCYGIKVLPTDRLGQVSALAALASRFLWFAIPLASSLIVVAKHRPAWWDMAVRIVCAAFAGLASAMVAGGILAMLRGTPFGLAADLGDSGVLAEWARRLQEGDPTPGLYPPLQIHFIAWISEIQGVTTTYALKYFQLISILAFGPAGYAAWRLLLRPPWALGVGVVCGLPMLEVYRLYPFLVLIVFVPVSISLLETVRTAAARPVGGLALRGAAYGAGLGVLFLIYSGWFQWSAPGFFVAALVVFPWRAGWRRGAVVFGAAFVAFAAIAGYSIARVLGAPPIHDYFTYFDSTVDPAYIAMWRGSLPGPWEHLWPPIGELGGVGLFTVLLCVGWAASIMLGARRTGVMAVSWIMIGTWFLRLHYARWMWKTQMVQLYPRTTAELLYCLLVLSGQAIAIFVERRVATASETSPLRTPWATIGAICGMALLFMSAGSAISDRYMPREASNDYGHLAWLSHTALRENQSRTRAARAEASSGDASTVIDRVPESVYESSPSATPDHEEWIEFGMPRGYWMSRLLLLPAPDGGFPVDFTFDVWDGKDWMPRVIKTGYVPGPGVQTFTWGRLDWTNRYRLHVTKLGRVGDHFALKLAEVEVYR